jgi:alpha-1,2-mannosyltransferase
VSMVALGRRYGVEATIFVVALAARLLVPVFGGGYRGFVGSDQAVYYAGSMAVSHGLVPYSGFSFVHPPVSLVALQPAAWVGRLTTDHAGFIAGNVLFAVLGAISAVLVARVARAAGGGVGAQLAGGLFYAVWMGSVGAEFSSRLEPLGNVVFVAGLLLLTRVRALEARASTRLTLLAGAVLGLSVSVKIWWAAPVLFVFLWEYGRSRDARRFGRLVLGAAVASVVVNGPLFLASRGRMWDYVVEAQLGRPRRHPELSYRLGTMTGVKDSLTNDVLAGVAMVVVGVVLVACVVVALASPGFREMACLFVFLACLLLWSPSFFPHYVDFLAVPAALTVAGAAHGLRRTAAGPTTRQRARSPVTVYAFVCLVAGLALTRLAQGPALVEPIPGQEELKAAAADLGCIKADLPMNLVVVDSLSRSFAEGCGNRVDVRGGALAMEETGPKNALVKRALVAYLRSGDAVVLNAHAMATIGQEPQLSPQTVLATNGEYTLLVVGPD